MYFCIVTFYSEILNQIKCHENCNIFKNTFYKDNIFLNSKLDYETK